MHAVTHPKAPFKTRSGSLEIRQIPAASDNLIWLLVDVARAQAAAVDGPDAEAVLAHCKEHGLSLTTILNTHTHGDHIGINRDLEQRGMLKDVRVVGPAKVGGDVPGITESVDEGDTVELFGLTGKVLLTEGHINGHISYLFEDVLLCGDTLFGAGCGYLFDGPPKKMFDSLTKLSALDAGTRVCCAHEYTQDNLRFAWSVEPDNQSLRERIGRVWRLRAGGESSVPSTIGEERETNPFLRFASPSLKQHVEAAMGAPLATPLDIFTATRALKDRKDYKKLPDSAFPV